MGIPSALFCGSFTYPYVQGVCRDKPAGSYDAYAHTKNEHHTAELRARGSWHRTVSPKLTDDDQRAWGWLWSIIGLWGKQGEQNERTYMTDEQAVDLGRHPLGPFLSEIEGGLRSGLFISPICIALTLPDICSSLASKDGEASTARYIAWYNENVRQPHSRLDGRGVYSLRCSMLHQGRQSHRKLGWDRIIWTSPKLSGLIMDESVIDNGSEQVLYLYAERFCLSIAVAALNWFKANQNDPNVTKNMNSLVALTGIQSFGPGVAGIGIA